MTHFAGGRLETLLDGKGNKTTYSYDGHGRLHRTRYPDPANVGTSSTTDYEEFDYDANSQVVSTRTRSGHVILTPRDALGRVTMKDLPGGTTEDVYYGYDNHGRLLSALYDNPGGSGVSQTYDELGRLKTRTVFGRQLSYQHDLAGRRERLTHPDGFYVDYGYTNLDELHTVTDSDGTVLATYGYDELGARASITRPNNAATTYVPDALKRLQQLSHDFAGTTSDMVAAFAYNPAGQVVARAVNNDAAYTWTPSTGTTVAQFDGRNQLADFAGTAVGSDANGNVSTGITNLTYTFDPQGQLRAAAGGSGVEVDYEPTGMLSRMEVGGNSTDFLYDGADLVAVYDASGDVLARYVHGPALDEPLVIYTGPETGNKTWLHADERGSIVARSDASGAATATAKYSSDGEGSTISVFGYTGQLYLSQLQLYYYKARMYSPKTARFVQPDPIGYSDGMNLFAYVGNDPINSRDPFGLAAATDPQFCNSMGMCVPIAYGQLQSWDPCDFACRAHQESQYRAMLANALDYAVIGAGALLIAFDVYNTATIVFAGPDTSLVGGPMIAGATARIAQRSIGRRLGDLDAFASQRGGPRKLDSPGHFKGTDALRRENKMAHDAATRAGLDREQRRILHDEISGRGISDFQELLRIAREIKAGKF